MIDAIRRIFEYHSVEIWVGLTVVLVLALIFWSFVISSERNGPRGPGQYR